MALESLPHSQKVRLLVSCNAYLDRVAALVVIGKQVKSFNLLFRFLLRADGRSDAMKLLEEKILKEGKVLDGDILKVDGFLNHRLDVALLAALGSDIAQKYKDAGATMILTVESSGIALAFAAAECMGLPVLVAKKHRSLNISDGVYASPVFSYTHKTENNVVVSKEYLGAGEKVLIVDDFLASGNAALGLLSLLSQAGAEAVGFAAAVEKEYQGGRALIEKKGVPVYSLARIKEMSAGTIVFD